MNKSDSSRETGFSGMGRWLAVASELPCSIIIMLFIGQFLGSAWWGPQGGMWGALGGAMIGFLFGVYSVFVTIRYYDRLEHKTKIKTTWLPPEEEIYEEFDFSDRMDDSEST